jgi:amidase
MGGTAVLKDFVPPFDFTVVSKLRSAGAVVLGKLNFSEGAAAGYNPSLDVPVNPWRADGWLGMSSSGSGVATAAGLYFAAIGTDTGGSIRNPASANGVVGLKPTYGRVSRYGVLAMAPSLDHVGSLARTAADATKAEIDKLSPHDLRRTCARLCYAAGGELEQIQFMLGYA